MRTVRLLVCRQSPRTNPFRGLIRTDPSSAPRNAEVLGKNGKQNTGNEQETPPNGDLLVAVSKGYQIAATAKS